MENSNCCSPNQDANSNCCPPNSTTENKVGKEKNPQGFKQKIGLLIMGLAIVFAISTAFKSNDITDLPPSIEDFEWLETDKKVAYILLEGTDEQKNEKIAGKVKSVVDELNETDGSAYFATLNLDNEHYEKFVEEIGIEETPSVAVLGRGGNVSLLNASVSSLKLVKAYVSATTPAASCNPAACSPAAKAKCAAKKSKS